MSNGVTTNGWFVWLIVVASFIVFIWVLALIALIIPSYFAGWKMYRKMNIAGWKFLIPIYGDYVLFEKLWKVKYYWIEYLFLVAGDVLMRLAGYFRETDPNVYNVLMTCGTAVFLISRMVIHFFLYKRLAWAFDKGYGFAFGLTVIPPLFIMILGFGESRYVYTKKEKKPLKKQQKNI